MADLFKKTTTPAADGPVNPPAEPKAKKEKAPAAPKPEKPIKTPDQLKLELNIAQKEWDALKEQQALENPVSADTRTAVTKARRKVRGLKKALGLFVPVADRPKKEKPVKEPKAKKEEAKPAAE